VERQKEFQAVGVSALHAQLIRTVQSRRHVKTDIYMQLVWLKPGQTLASPWWSL